MVREGNERKVADYSQQLADEQRRAMGQLPPPSNPSATSGYASANPAHFQSANAADDEWQQTDDRDPLADKERETLLAKARQEYDQLLERARLEIGAEKEKAIVALRREAVDLSIAAASKLLEAQLDSETNRKLVMQYLAQLEAGRAR